jgi:hypothetical protein
LSPPRTLAGSDVGRDRRRALAAAGWLSAPETRAYAPQRASVNGQITVLCQHVSRVTSCLTVERRQNERRDHDASSRPRPCDTGSAPHRGPRDLTRQRTRRVRFHRGDPPGTYLSGRDNVAFATRSATADSPRPSPCIRTRWCGRPSRGQRLGLRFARNGAAARPVVQKPRADGTSVTQSECTAGPGEHEVCSTAVLRLVVRRDRRAAGRQQRIVEIGPRPPPLRGPMCSRLRGQSPMRAVTPSRAPGALSGGEPPGVMPGAQ